MAGNVGRPSIFSKEICEEIFDRMANHGQSLRIICKDDHMPERTTITRWLWSGNPEHEEFCVQYARAREALMDFYGDEIIEISDDSSRDTIIKKGRYGDEYEAENTEWINRSRLRVDSRKWLMSKIAGKKYGDKQQIEHSANENMTAILQVVSKDKKI